MPYYEDLEQGEKFTTVARTITDGIATQLISIGGFIEPMFNDEMEANKTPLGWRALPGPMIFALMGGLLATTMGGQATDPGVALFVGVNNMRVSRPLKTGDTVHLECELTEKTETSNPRWGRVVYRQTLINQKGEVVCTADTVELYERKPE